MQLAGKSVFIKTINMMADVHSWWQNCSDQRLWWKAHDISIVSQLCDNNFNIWSLYEALTFGLKSHIECICLPARQTIYSWKQPVIWTINAPVGAWRWCSQLTNMGATRAQVLMILQPLVCDIQRKIMRTIFPTYAETHKLVKGLACHPGEWLDLIEMLTVFAHSDIPRVILRHPSILSEELHFVEHCCRSLRFECLSSTENSIGEPETKSVQNSGEVKWHVKWTRTLELGKSANWSMRTEQPALPAYSSAYAAYGLLRIPRAAAPCKIYRVNQTKCGSETKKQLKQPSWAIESDFLGVHSYLYNVIQWYDSDSDW